MSATMCYYVMIFLHKFLIPVLTLTIFAAAMQYHPLSKQYGLT